ncbi:DUF1329 domain-containing protein [Endozoicomonas sp. OPT23]|uniref:DUF1329 domain-containing protein n=1 Tax=Endozoicomonas sp. OPT23 TaxID=2072845 RepID=UPI00129BF1E7|nr:DUF1329 domain-containing protein [Endozoicomonas sp. OPT23]MRI33834.1 DUF1329 domain-containing protein [Endozoicomonas sp. OPT23]
MKTIKIIKNSSLVLLTAGSITAGTVMAKVSPEEAAQLGKTLTPTGAIKAGNKEGTIPAWNPAFKVPSSYKKNSNVFPDPYPEDKPLFTITPDNLNQYRDKLSPGQIKMFEAYPDTFRMPVYTSRRNGSYSDFIEKNTRLNATRSVLDKSGDGVINAYGGAPFPIPKRGEEVIWNLNQAGVPYYLSEERDSMLVYNDGSQLFGKQVVTTLSPYFDEDSSIDEFYNKRYSKVLYLSERRAPAREKGEGVLVHEPINYVSGKRAAWTYTPGVRKVRRAPNIKFDVLTELGDFMPSDSTGVFTGSTEKYNWKLAGRKELYIPYNAYRFEDPDVEFEDLLHTGHVNPDYMRYELHRVWVVEATLKDDQRHVYGKRVLYVDEDSWTPSVSDFYNSSGELLRMSLLNSIYRYDLPGIMTRSTLFHDFERGAYLAHEMTNRTSANNPPINTNVKKMSYFKPRTLRKLGIR